MENLAQFVKVFHIYLLRLIFATVSLRWSHKDQEENNSLFCVVCKSFSYLSPYSYSRMWWNFRPAYLSPPFVLRS